MAYFLRCMKFFFSQLFRTVVLAVTCIFVGFMGTTTALVVCVSFIVLLYRELKRIECTLPLCSFEEYDSFGANADFMLALDGALFATTGLVFTALGYQYFLVL